MILMKYVITYPRFDEDLCSVSFVWFVWIFELSSLSGEPEVEEVVGKSFFWYAVTVAIFPFELISTRIAQSGDVSSTPTKRTPDLVRHLKKLGWNNR